MKLGRRFIRRKMASLTYGPLTAYPILFANGFPKSGTHLLLQLLRGLSKLGPVVDSGLPAIVMYEGASGRERSVEEILGELNRLQPGDIAYGHLHAKPSILKVLTAGNYIPFFIYRDPRDVVVSHVFYVTEIEMNHVHHRYYTDVLESFDERLMTSILGISGSKFPFPAINNRFEPYLGWMDSPLTLSLRYEDFLLNLETTLARIIERAKSGGFPLQVTQEKAIDHLKLEIDPNKSPTFRSGKVGKWKEYFNEHHIKIFKEISGDLLIRLGYEKDKNW